MSGHSIRNNRIEYEFHTSLNLYIVLDCTKSV